MKTNTRPTDVGLLSAESAAEVLGTNVRHLRRLTTEGLLSYVKVGRFVKYERAALDTYVQSHRIDAHTEGSL
jgi:excisionase family DNA binding protein